MKALELYHELRKSRQNYEVAEKLICYGAVDAYVQAPTEKEYEVIAQVCMNTYLKVDECDLIKLADIVSEKYANSDFDLEQLKKMSKWDVLELM